MQESERLSSQIAQFLPEEAMDIVVHWILDYKILLTITRKRNSILGDYRWPRRGKGHMISINGDLNKYAFLVTLVHEMAHLTTWEKYQHRVSSHGNEWKSEFKRLMDEFSGRKIFPGDVRAAIKNYLLNPSATHCHDPVVMKVLNKYNKKPVFHLEDIEQNGLFLWMNDRVFRKGERLRKRYKCVELKTKKIYLFSPAAEVEKV